MFKNSFNAIREQMNVNTIHTMSNRSLYVLECVNFLNNKNSRYYKTKHNLYNNITESAGLRSILEFYTDYATQSSTLIDETIQFIKNKITEFEKVENDFINTDELVKSHKKDILDELKWYNDNSIEGFNYTIDKFIPEAKALVKFDANLFSDIFNPQIDNLEVNSFQNVLDNIDLEQDLRKMRGMLLGTSEDLSSTEYAKGLYGVFRDNQIMQIELNIDEEYIKTVAKDWFSFKSSIVSNLNEHLTMIKQQTKKILERIEAVCKNNNGMTIAGFTKLLPGDINITKIDGKDVDQEGINMAPEVMFEINKYCKLKLDQLQAYLDLICIGFGEKLDACHAYIMQTQSILHDVIDVLDHPESYYDARESKDSRINKINKAMDKLISSKEGDK